MIDDICAELDHTLLAGREDAPEDILHRLGIAEEHPQRNVFILFINRYCKLTEEYLENKEELEHELQIHGKRIGWNSFFGAAIGSILPPFGPAAAAGALMGAGITLYDELEGRRRNFVPAALGALIGGLVGSLFDSKTSALCSYVGAGIGAAIGALKTYYSMTPPVQTQEIENSLLLFSGSLR